MDLIHKRLSATELTKSDSSTREVVRKLNELLSSSSKPDVIAYLFSGNAVFDIPGATELVPWIGKRYGRKEIADFVRDLREYIEPISFQVTSTVVEGEKAITLGQLESRVRSTGRSLRRRSPLSSLCRTGRSPTTASSSTAMPLRKRFGKQGSNDGKR